MNPNKQSRLFTASLKPAWDELQMAEFLAKTKGTIEVWAITHDKDINDNGELIEPHTHVILEYETPRKLSTIANLLNVAENFIEYGKSRNALLRYLTHKDDRDKFQYEEEEVWTNTGLLYADAMMGANMNDREIAQYIMEGKGIELLGIVPSHKLRTIQAFLQFDRTGQLKAELESVKEGINGILSKMVGLEQFATQLIQNTATTLDQAKEGLISIASEIKAVRLTATLQRNNNQKWRKK
jgi:hypothetical protein